MLRKFNELMGFLSGIILLVVTFLLIYDVFARYLLGEPSIWAQAVSQYLMLVAIFLGTSYCFLDDGHVNVEIVIERVGLALRSKLLCIGYLLAAVYSAVMLWYTLKLTFMALRMNWMTMGSFPFPTWILYVVMAFGCVLLILTIASKMVAVCRSASSGRGQL